MDKLRKKTVPPKVFMLSGHCVVSNSIMAIAANVSNNQTRQIVAQAMPQLHYLSDYKLQPCIEGTKEKVYHEVYLGMNGGFQIHVPRNFWHSRTQNYD